MNQRLWIVCYDIANDHRLRKVAKVMERYGTRAQKSVFECWLTDPLLQEMKQAVEKVMDRQADSLRLYPLCQSCQQLARAEGDARLVPPKGYVIA